MTVGPFAEAVREAILELHHSDPQFVRELAKMIESELGNIAAGFVDTTEFAARRHLNRDTVTKMANAGRIAGAKKDGREWRLPADAVIAPANREVAGAALTIATPPTRLRAMGSVGRRGRDARLRERQGGRMTGDRHSPYRVGMFGAPSTIRELTR